MMLNRTRGMVNALGLDVGLLGFFRATKRADERAFPVYAKLNAPTVAPLHNSKNTGQVISLWCTDVLIVKSLRNVAQIGYGIVLRVAINVVNAVLRPLAIEVKPSNTMGAVNLAVNRNLDSVLYIEKTNNITNIASLANNKFAGKNAAFWVVVKKLTNTVGGQWRMNHLGHGNARVVEVRNAVVARNSIDGFQVLRRETTMHIEPCKVGRTVRDVVNVDRDSSTISVSACNASSGGDASAHKPSENTSFWIVIEKFAQTFCGKIGLSHDAPSKRFGQRPGCVDSTSRLRHFNMGAA